MKILLVEDSRALAAVMKARLESFGFQVTCAENGELAVAAYPTVAPDLILMDIEMPVMNGFEATNRIRALEAAQEWAWTPILFLTASATPENLVTAIEAGGDDFLAKSVPEAVLHAKMKAMTRIAALRRRLAVANRLLKEQASRDGLTGLWNRRYMDLQVDLLWTDASRHRHAFGLLMIDIDNFKKYNDHYSHQAGDDCLRALAAAVGEVAVHAQENGAANTFAARYGGEEFALVVPAASEAAFREIAARVVDSVREKAIAHVMNASWGIATASVGGCYRKAAGGRVVDLFRGADAALYRAKAGGRNRFELDLTGTTG